MRRTITATNGQKVWDDDESHVDKQVRTERRSIFEETDDSPQLATGTTYDLAKCGDEIIDLVDDEPQS